MLDIRVDTSQWMQHAKELQQVPYRAAIAVRQTLNSAAFNTKKTYMPHESDVFVHRHPTFFKATSGVNPATGLDVSKMESKVGFNPRADDKSHSVEDLEQQEEGGAIANRAYQALPSARNGNNRNKNIKKKLRMHEIRQNIADPKKLPINKSNFRLYETNERGLRKTPIDSKERWLLTALAVWQNRFEGIDANKSQHTILSTAHNALYQITAMDRVVGKNGRKIYKVRRRKIYSVKKGRHAHPKAHHFMAKASTTAKDAMFDEFMKNAAAQIAKI